MDRVVALSNPNKDQKKGREVRGRKDREKQEVVIKIAALRDNVADMVVLHNKAQEAATVLNDKIKAVAEKAGLLASVVRKIVVARAGENWQERKRECEQLNLCFDEIGQTH